MQEDVQHATELAEGTLLRTGERKSGNGAIVSQNRLLRALDYAFILRPTLFFPVWIVFLAGHFRGKMLAAPYGISPAIALQQETLWLLLALTGLMGSAFILNQIVDAPGDRENDKLFLIAHGHVAMRAAMLEAVFLAGISLFTAFIWSMQIGVLYLAIMFVTGVLYSVPPFVWKDRPLGGLLANCLGASLIFLAGWASSGQSPGSGFTGSVPYALAVGAVYLYTTLLDMRGDARFNKVTFAVRFGRRATILAGLLFVGGTAALGWRMQDAVIFYPALLALPFFCIATARPVRKDVVHAIKMPILFLAIVDCMLWPPFLLLLASVFFGSKFYYYHRFSLRYPTLDGRS